MTPASCIAVIMRRPWLTLVLSLLVIAALTSGTGRLATVEVDVRNHFGMDNSHIVALDRLEDTYALSDAALVAVAPQGGTVFTREALAAIDELTEQLWLTPHVTRVDSITNYSHSQGIGDDLVVETLVTDAGSLSDGDLERIEGIALATEEVAGRFVSRDGRVASLVVSVALPEDRQLGKAEVTDHLHAVATEARAKHAAIDYHLTGEIVLNRAMREAVDTDMGILAPVAFGAMLLVALVLLRSIWATATIFVMLVSVLVASLGFTGWTGMTLFGESGAALFVLMSVTVAHSVHIIEAVMEGMRQGLDRRKAVIRSLELNLWPVFLTSLTTSIGFLSLNVADMPPFQVMGNIVAFGSMCAFACSVTLLPVLLCLLPLGVGKQGPGAMAFFDRFGRFVVSYRTLLLCSSGAVVVVLIAGVSRIELQENWLENLDESYEFRRSIEFVSESFNGVETYEYSLDAGRKGGITDVGYLERVDAFAEWCREQPEVAHVFAITDILKRLNMNLHGDDPDQRVLPASSDLAAQYLLLYEFSLPVGRDLNNLINVERSASRMSVTLSSLTSTEKIELDDRAHEWLRINAPGMETRATGVTVVGAHSIQRNIEDMLLGTFIAMAIVSSILLLVFRSLRLGFITLIPNFFPAAMAMGLWGYVVVEVGIAAAVVTAIAFGIIVDDTIHFMTKYVSARKRGELPSQSVQYAFRIVGRPLMVTTLVFALGFLVFAASGLVPNQTLGVLTAMTVIIALAADFLFLPPLLMLLDRAGESQDEIRERLGKEGSSPLPP